MKKIRESNLALGVIGVLILALGVFVGVLLVGQNQSFRNKAKESQIQRVTICHRDNSGVWEETEVPFDDLKFYIDSGDILGQCP